jgi:hypothetical protein
MRSAILSAKPEIFHQQMALLIGAFCILMTVFAFFSFSVFIESNGAIVDVGGWVRIV